MVICGVELKGNKANLVVLDGDSQGFSIVETTVKKIPLDHDELSENVRSFYQTFSNFVIENRINTIAIKIRSRRGQFVGGPVSFKLEGIIQLIEDREITLLAPTTIASFLRKNPMQPPSSLKKYQHTAFETARTYLNKCV